MSLARLKAVLQATEESVEQLALGSGVATGEDTSEILKLVIAKVQRSPTAASR